MEEHTTYQAEYQEWVEDLLRWVPILKSPMYDNIDHSREYVAGVKANRIYPRQLRANRRFVIYKTVSTEMEVIAR